MSQVLREENDGELIDLGPEDRNNHGASGGNGGGGGGTADPTCPPGFIGFPYMPVIPGRISPQPQEYHPFQYPQMPAEEVKRPLGDSGLPPFSPSAVPGNIGGFVHPQV